ncbi:MAG: hypothetical protein SGBAC_012818, partial [Bacillariaceae sp.]
LTYARLPEGLQIIPQRLFFCCEMLVDVNVPSSVIEIEEGAFACCARLASLDLPTGLISIGVNAFSSTPFKHFHFPATVEIIDSGVLRGCNELETVILPPELETVPDGIFHCCSKLKDVSIPKSVTWIGDYAFSHCGLTHVDLSRCNLTSMKTSAFAHCSELKRVLLPRTGLIRIEEETFSRCTSLTHFWIPPTVEHIERNAFDGCTSLLSVEVPETLGHMQFVGYWGYKGLINLNLLPLSIRQKCDSIYGYRFVDAVVLGEAVDPNKDFWRKLRGRFRSLPLHRACYFQSYHTLKDNIQNIRGIVDVDPDACNKVDLLEMSPFHILALSQEPRLFLFQELLTSESCCSGRVDILMGCRDVFGCTAFDYLCKNIHSPRTVDVTKSLLPCVLDSRVSFLGLERWRDEVFSGLDRTESTARDIVASCCQKLEEYERLEALSLLELSVWRMKLQSENAASNMDTRESCRVKCRSSIVLSNVMPFMDDTIARIALL